MRRNQAYSRFYVFWSKVIVTDLIPYFTILTLNSFIVTKIVKSIRFRARILQARNMQAEVSYLTSESKKSGQTLLQFVQVFFDSDVMM